MQEVLPAGAGVIPVGENGSGMGWRAPRRCGGDPITVSDGGAGGECSPQVRG